MMRESSEEKTKIVRKIRFIYCITVTVCLLIVLSGYICYFVSSMPNRCLMMQLKRAKNIVQIENILEKSPIRLSDDRMAEVYINCAMNAFNEKEYEESCRLLRKVIQSNAHPEFKGMSQIELANACFLMGKYQEGIQELDRLIASPEIPEEFKTTAKEIKMGMYR